MEEINLEYRIPRFIVNLFTTLMFSAFTAYQVYLFFEINAQRVGRLFGIIIFLCLSLASLFEILPVDALRKVRPALLILGLIFYFIIKLFSIKNIVAGLDFSNIPSVMNLAIFAFDELALLILAFYCLVMRPNLFFNIMRKPTVILMTVVIVLFVFSLIMECIFMLKYGMKIDISLKNTLVSRLLYCFAFSGLAVGFMIPNMMPANPIQDFEDEDIQDLTLGKIDDDFVL